MSNFVVSARKYRPLTFNSVVGQQHITDTLKNAIRNEHVAQAFLFCGPRGVGKTTCARILAKVLNCDHPTADFEPCDTCESCLAFRQNQSLNIYELDAASNNSVEHIRALIEQVRFAPQSGKRKIYIIDEVHMLSTQAFNAFLKTLEEPPPYAIFILATTEKHKIIPTILSRCQIFEFRRIQVADMESHLRHICAEEKITADDDALNIIGQKADGALRDALSIFDRVVSFSGSHISYQQVIDNLNILDYDYYFKVVEAILSEDAGSLMLLFDNILSRGFEADLFMNGLAEHLRNLLVCQDERTLKLLEVSGNIRERYKQQSQIAPLSLLLSCLQIASDSDINYKMARNKKLHVELALTRMCYVMRGVNLAINPPVTAAIVEKKTLDSKVGEAPPPNYSGKKDDVSDMLQQTLNIRLAKVGNLEAEMRQSQPETSNERIILTPELVQATWNEYTEALNSGSAKVMLKNAEIELNNSSLTVRVGSTMAQNTIRDEKSLVSFLREKFGIRDLSLNIVIDESKRAAMEATTVSEKPKVMGAKEVYAELVKKNPLLADLQKRFDLRLDN